MRIQGGWVMGFSPPRVFGPTPGKFLNTPLKSFFALRCCVMLLRLLSLLSDIIQLHTGCPTKHDSLLNSFKCLLPYTVLDIKTRSLFR